ncbi:MAG: assimilatory sulfite reductase (NADPH) flavoprotein subunit [Verrucomicrobia bacterium]|nr:assimilatory sulfite reductase (NADPH) flavoprotein subunit [Verrucomicrobiota bacterium]
MQIPDSAPFSEEQRVALTRLLSGITPSQFTWLTGFVAGVEAAIRQSGLTPSVAVEPAVGAMLGAGLRAASVPSLAIVYGSESGNAEGLAQMARKEAGKRGIKATVVDMADRTVADLAREKHLVVITSTWGDGDPPDNAVGLHAALMSPEAPSFGGTSYAVCGLGDTSYDKFCQTGKDFDRRLEELGAQRFYERIDCDTDYEQPFARWMDAMLVEFLKRFAAVDPAPVAVVGGGAGAVASEYGKKKPFPAPLKEKILLSGRGSGKEVWHHELLLEGSGMSYEPGDSLAVVPSNRAEDVERLLAVGKFRGEQVMVDGVSCDLSSALQVHYDCTGLTKNLASKYNEVAKSDKLSKLLGDSEVWRQYLDGRQVVDLLADFPVAGMEASDFLGLLRKMPPRLYSIASSLRACPGEVHLTVATVRYETHGRDRVGVASSFLADRVKVGGTVPVYTTTNKNFKLPVDGDTPIIMVGPGTGVAPFRAFLQERQAVGAKGRNWLFFGDQRYTLDFLYQVEWQEYLKDGLLTRLDVAFSRDQKHKIYVQNRMEERAAELWRWLEEGACFYVCGDAERMAGDVHEMLIRIAETHGGMSRIDAEAHVEGLRKAKRYLRDVY